MLENLKGRDHLENISSTGRRALKWILEYTVCEGVYWMQLTWDRVQWQAFVNTVLNHWVP